MSERRECFRRACSKLAFGTYPTRFGPLPFCQQHGTEEARKQRKPQ